VDGSQAPVRRLFELQLLKGARIKACWGFSLDCVSHILGGRVCWHRSDKSARLDVIVDPKSMPQPSFLDAGARFSADWRRLLPEASFQAQTTWKQGTSYQGMLEIVQEIREGKINCLGFYTYTQLPLAYAFLSARVGDVESAERELDSCGSLRRLDGDIAATLKQLVRHSATG